MTPPGPFTAPAVRLDRTRFDAVIFDLDGVITRTDEVHAAAWKRLFDAYREERQRRHLPVFPPFDPDADYRQHVDGKPRYDGIQAFLAAHGIELPFGQRNDPPELETICGLGNRKNTFFQEQLRAAGVRVFESTIALVKALRAAGFKVAVISASANCPAVLEAAGVTDLFEAQVDGIVARQLGLAGKPDPAVFLEAARRLQVAPARAVVVEDAVAGVTAGRRGAFGLVIGVDRTGHPERLRDNGADVVVSDLAEVGLSTADEPAERLTSELPSALAHLDEIAAGDDRRLAFFLDYDGTLTPIVPRPEDAVLDESVRDILRRLAARWPVAVISGRDLADVQQRVGLDHLVYAGSHGFDIAGPDGLRLEQPDARACIPALDAAETGVRTALAGLAGAQIERKKFSLAVHYRNVPDAQVADVALRVQTVAAAQPRLRLGRGKKVFDFQPRLDWHKGRAVTWLLRTLALDGPDVRPVYVGDDLTDEDAFACLPPGGVGIVVRDEPRDTTAHFALESPAEVARLLAHLAGDVAP